MPPVSVPVLRRPRLTGLVVASLLAGLSLPGVESRPSFGVTAATVEPVVSAPAPEAATEPAPAPEHPHVWPTCTYVTSEFGTRWGRPHEGLDLGGPIGTPVGSMAAGTVTFAGWQRGYGQIAIVTHDGGLTSSYAHLDRLDVTHGEAVGRGQRLGTLGATGSVTASHLHFEVHENDVPVDPRHHLPAEATCAVE